jgi:hypothetical protein
MYWFTSLYGAPPVAYMYATGGALISFLSRHPPARPRYAFPSRWRTHTHERERDHACSPCRADFPASGWMRAEQPFNLLKKGEKRENWRAESVEKGWEKNVSYYKWSACCYRLHTQQFTCEVSLRRSKKFWKKSRTTELWRLTVYEVFYLKHCENFSF